MEEKRLKSQKIIPKPYRFARLCKKCEKRFVPSGKFVKYCTKCRTEARKKTALKRKGKKRTEKEFGTYAFKDSETLNKD